MFLCHFYEEKLVTRNQLAVLDDIALLRCSFCIRCIGLSV